MDEDHILQTLHRIKDKSRKRAKAEIDSCGLFQKESSERTDAFIRGIQTSGKLLRNLSRNQMLVLTSGGEQVFTRFRGTPRRKSGSHLEDCRKSFVTIMMRRSVMARRYSFVFNGTNAGFQARDIEELPM